MKHLFGAMALSLWAVSAAAERPSLEFRLGLDYFTLDQSDIRGLNGMSILKTTPQGYYGGASIFSAALGNGGGFFVGGWEIGKRTAITDNLFWDASLFVGGGGGANQVTGDGLMLRPQVHFGYDFGDFRIGAGGSFTSVSGSGVSSPAFALTFTKPLNLELISGHPTSGFTLRGATQITSITPTFRTYLPINNKKRGGAELQTMELMGAELTFAKSNNSELFIQASGVVGGDAEGYADWVLGKRFLWGTAPLTFYADIGAGVGGGGAVDTGGGLIAAANAGARIKVLKRFDLALGFGIISSINGDFTVLTPTAKASLSFGAGNAETPETVRWQISSGLTQLLTGQNFRKAGATSSASPAMINVDIDVFLRDNLYLTGQAFTALSGNAGGFQMGLVGFGYTRTISDNFWLSGELLLGSAAGAGVNAKGGLVAGYKVEVDYRLSDTTRLTLGVGQVRTLQSGGLRPAMVNLGLKFPITTLH